MKEDVTTLEYKASRPLSATPDLPGLVYKTTWYCPSHQPISCIAPQHHPSLWLTLTSRSTLWSLGFHIRLQPTCYSAYTTSVQPRSTIHPLGISKVKWLWPCHPPRIASTLQLIDWVTSRLQWLKKVSQCWAILERLEICRRARMNQTKCLQDGWKYLLLAFRNHFGHMIWLLWEWGTNISKWHVIGTLIWPYIWQSLCHM